MIQIKSLNSIYNPYSFNGRDVNFIHLYNKKGEITYQTRWFGANNKVKIFELPIGEVIKKNKFKADGTVFYVSVNNWSGKMWDIYIPEEMLNHNNGEVTLTGEYCDAFLNEDGEIDYKKVYETRTFKVTDTF